MDQSKNQHFKIPDQDVIRQEHNLTGRSHERDVYHVEHGEKLIGSLNQVEIVHRNKRGPLSDELMVFKVAVAPKVHLHNKATREFLETSGLTIHAVKNDGAAVVSTNKEKWDRLRLRLEGYKNRNFYKDFQDIEQFSPLEHAEKESESLKKILNQDDKQEEPVDIQIMLLPNLTQQQKEKVIRYLIQQVVTEDGSIAEETLFLSDGTPVIRAIVPASIIPLISVEESVYKVMQTDFFSQGTGSVDGTDIGALKIDTSVSIGELPVVVVLDTGINLPANLRPLLVDQWQAPGVGASDKVHGTQVAARVIFGNDLKSQVQSGVLLPKVKVIDAQISDNTPITPKQFIERIEAAVVRFKDRSKIFNLSFNAGSPIEGDDISFTAAEIDSLSIKHDVQFIISSGNHQLWAVHNNLTDILDDSDSRISAPADSILSIVVGSVMTENVSGSLSQKGDISPFSRIGPGFAGTMKPDFVAPGGSCYPNVLASGDIEPVPYDTNCATILTANGKIGLDVGTSFSAPIVSGELAQVLNRIEDSGDNLLLSKALLIHTSSSLWDLEGLDEDEIEELAKYQGNGLINLDRALYSTASSVSFIRTGTLDRVNKEKIKFYVPTILANQRGRNTARVTVTVVTRPDVDRTKGTEYCKSYVRASLKKVDGAGRLLPGNPDIKIGRDKYQAYQHFSRLFSRFESGDWQVWLQPFARWDTPNDQPIPYALVVTIEDTSNQLDLYNQIQVETGSRYTATVGTRVRV